MAGLEEPFSEISETDVEPVQPLPKAWRRFVVRQKRLDRFQRVLDPNR